MASPCTTPTRPLTVSKMLSKRALVGRYLSRPDPGDLALVKYIH